MTNTTEAKPADAAAPQGHEAQPELCEHGEPRERHGKLCFNADGSLRVVSGKGRGPTRPALVFADLVDDIAAGDNPRAISGCLARGHTSKMLRETAKLKRNALRAHVENEEASISCIEAEADLLARAEKLPEHLRVALVSTIEAAFPLPAPTAS
jgi:hypothetical protein